MSIDQYSIIVGIDFGTTASSFAYCHTSNIDQEVVINSAWPGQALGVFKTNTVLLYDSKSWDVIAWGANAVVRKFDKKKKKMANDTSNGGPAITVGLFKLHLADIREEDKPPLPMGLDYRKCIVDYLSEMRKVIRTTLDTRWPGIDFYRNVKFIITVPLNFSEKSRTILRECALNAGLLEFLTSPSLEFVTEPDAAATHCISSVRQLQAEENIMVVDCGGGVIDITIRKLTTDGKLAEIIKYTSEFGGSIFVDKGFIRFLCERFGLFEALQQVQMYHYDQLQYLIYEFSQRVKLSFTGDPSTFKSVELDLEDCCPALLNYVTGDVKKQMEKSEWLIGLGYEDVKVMFDPVIQRIIQMIGGHMTFPNVKCAALFLVGGFSESLYFQRQVREAFQLYVPIIEIPKQPTNAILRGAIQHVLGMRTIRSRILRYTYGVQVTAKWKKGDPPQRKTQDGLMYVFHTLVKRGTEVKVDQMFGYVARPSGSHQIDMTFDIYASPNTDVRFCDEPGNRYLGTLKVDLSDIKHGGKKLVEFSLVFGLTKIKAIAKDQKTGRVYHASLNLDF
ncbi:2226_t:CDS:2 [Acaulospora morrowiae]|uniref:2226_t:CDS:1 n=1 Tax=Acaulospora morrowiae TaxID=94023 RepID=A0A9N9FF56_9GLOM|nr:2226_t:CDS:2 [Acaulospora morrowiae]